MSTFIPDPNKKANTTDSLTFKNKVDNANIKVPPTDFFNESTNNISRIREKYETTNYYTNNNRRNIRQRLDTSAIRDKKFNFYSQQYNDNYPQLSNIVLCDQRISSVFNNGNFWTTTTLPGDGNKSASFPFNRQFNFVKNAIRDTYQCIGSYADGSNAGGGGGDELDENGENPVEKLCYEDAPEFLDITALNLKNVLYGYAFYTHQLRQVNIPNVGDVDMICAGGHTCCRTNFTPYLIVGSNTIAANEISLNNLPSCGPNTTPPVPGFVDLTGYDRSAAFSFVVPDTSSLSTAYLTLNCADENCHNGVTMVVLVAVDADTDEHYIIFQDCVEVGCSTPKLIGRMVNPSTAPVICGSIPPSVECPPPVCSQFVRMSIGMSDVLPHPSLASDPSTIAFINKLNNTIQNQIVLNITGDWSPNFNAEYTIAQDPGSPYYAYVSVVGSVISSTTFTFTVSINLFNAFIVPPYAPYNAQYFTTSSNITIGNNACSPQGSQFSRFPIVNNSRSLVEIPTLLQIVDPSSFNITVTLFNF